MADLSAGLRKATMLYGAILAGARAGLGTADLWASIRQTAEAQGTPLSGVSAANISTLRGFAGAQIKADAALAAAPFGSTIDASMIALAPYARSAAEMNAAPRFNVTMELGFLQNGEFGSASYTVSYTGFLPPTTDELLGDLQGAADDLGSNYGFTPGDILSVSIARV